MAEQVLRQMASAKGDACKEPEDEFGESASHVTGLAPSVDDLQRAKVIKIPEGMVEAEARQRDLDNEEMGLDNESEWEPEYWKA